MQQAASGSAPLQIAVVGGGIASMGAAWLLDCGHHVTLFEASAELGGHSNTVTVDDGGRALGVDTGFMVYNAANYPNLVALFDALGVATHASDMSFPDPSVHPRRDGTHPLAGLRAVAQARAEVSQTRATCIRHLPLSGPAMVIEDLSRPLSLRVMPTLARSFLAVLARLDHRDYWDAAAQVYAQLPLFGSVLRWLQARLG